MVIIECIRMHSIDYDTGPQLAFNREVLGQFGSPESYENLYQTTGLKGKSRSQGFPS